LTAEQTLLRHLIHSAELEASAQGQNQEVEIFNCFAVDYCSINSSAANRRTAAIADSGFQIGYQNTENAYFYFCFGLFELSLDLVYALVMGQ
jgi:hypothetical protein